MKKLMFLVCAFMFMASNSFAMEAGTVRITKRGEVGQSTQLRNEIATQQYKTSLTEQGITGQQQDHVVRQWQKYHNISTPPAQHQPSSSAEIGQSAWNRSRQMRDQQN